MPYKILLTLILAISLAVPSVTANRVYDFQSRLGWDPMLPTSGVDAKRYTSPRVYTNQKDPDKVMTGFGIYHNGAALVFYSSAFRNPTAYVDVMSAEPTSRIIITSSIHSSTSSQIEVYAGSQYLGNATLTEAADYVFEVPPTLQEPYTTYRITSPKTQNAQITKIELVNHDNTNGIVVGMQHPELYFAATSADSQTLPVPVMGYGLDYDITAIVEGPFEIVWEELDADGGLVMVGTDTHVPGDHEGTLTFISGDKKAEVSLRLYVSEHAGTAADPLTLSELIAMDCHTDAYYCVKGVVGTDTCVDISDEHPTGLTKDRVKTNIPMVCDELPDVTVPVELRPGETLDRVNIVDNPINIGKDIIMCGYPAFYFGRHGIKDAELVMLSLVTMVEGNDEGLNERTSYYDLEGRRIPGIPSAPGVYIKVCGSKVTKITL